jgi:hypothetical protein
MGERRHRGEQGHGLGVAEAKPESTLVVVGAREHDRLQSCGVGQAGLALAQGAEEPGVIYHGSLERRN